MSATILLKSLRTPYILAARHSITQSCKTSIKPAHTSCGCCGRRSSVSETVPQVLAQTCTQTKRSDQRWKSHARRRCDCCDKPTSQPWSALHVRDIDDSLPPKHSQCSTCTHCFNEHYLGKLSSDSLSHIVKCIFSSRLNSRYM